MPVQSFITLTLASDKHSSFYNTAKITAAKSFITLTPAKDKHSSLLPNGQITSAKFYNIDTCQGQTL